MPETPLPSRDEVLALLARGAERDLDDLEAKRLEDALAADPALADDLLAPLPGEELLGDATVEMPSVFEWKRVERGLADAGVALPATHGTSGPPSSTTSASPSDAPGRTGRKPGFGLPLLLLTAATLLCVGIVRMIVNDGLAEPEQPPVAEVLDLREDAESLILFPDGDDDGGVIIFVTST